MWKSIIRDYPDEQVEWQKTNPLYEEWLQAVMEEPWFLALRDLVKLTGTWIGSEAELMGEINIRVNREVYESEDFPSVPQKLMVYYEIIFLSYPNVDLGILDYRKLKKNDLEDFDVPEWGPEAPILLQRGWAGTRPSYKMTMYLLLYKYRSPLPLAVLMFTNDSYKFTRKKRSWSGSTTELAEVLLGHYPWPGDPWCSCPELPSTPEDPDSREAKWTCPGTVDTFPSRSGLCQFNLLELRGA